MNQKVFEKVIKTIRSCNTQDQYLNTIMWINNLRELYNFTSKQKYVINEEYIDKQRELDEPHIC